MSTQVYNFQTRFNFGKHKGKTLLEVLQNYGEHYIGYCIVMNELRFILDLKTIKALDAENLFDDLEFSYYGSTGSFPVNALIVNGKNLDKKWIMDVLMFRLNEFTNDPHGYELLVNEWWKAGRNIISITNAIHPARD